MNASLQFEESPRAYDAIIVGSGPGGAMVAKDLSRRGKRVLILERGDNRPMKGGLLALASLIQQVPINETVEATRAMTTGGTTSVYFAVAYPPPLDVFKKLGIDLSSSFEEVKTEVPLALLPDELCGAQVLRVRDSAMALGYRWTKNLAMIDQSKWSARRPRHGIWNARSLVRDAVEHGAVLINGATVRKVLLNNNHAIGVEYTAAEGKQRDARTVQVYGNKIILAAGAFVTPVVLRECGLQGVASRGFYADPTTLVLGQVKGLKGTEVLPGSMGDNGETGDFEGPILGDGCIPRMLYRGFMLATRRYSRLFSHSSTIGVGVLVQDRMGGGLREDGRLYKTFTEDEQRRLSKGLKLAEEVIRKAGGTKIYHSSVSASHVGGAVSIGEFVDADLQTEIRNLHVCDASVLPENVRQPPTLTLLCLGKHLATQLARTI